MRVLNTIDFNVSTLASRLGAGKPLFDSVRLLKAVVCQQSRHFAVVKRNLEQALVAAPNTTSIEIRDSKLTYTQFCQFVDVLRSTQRRNVSRFSCSCYCDPNSTQTLHLSVSDVRVAYYCFESERVRFMTARHVEAFVNAFEYDHESQSLLLTSMSQISIDGIDDIAGADCEHLPTTNFVLSHVDDAERLSRS